MAHRFGRQVEGQQEGFICKHTLEQQHGLGAFKKSDAAVQEGRLGMPPGQKRAERRQDRVRVALLHAHRRRPVLGRDRQPGRAGGKASQRSVGPRQRGTATVAALEIRPEGDAIRVLQRLKRHLGLGQAQLLALVQAHRAAQRAQHRHQHPCQARIGRIAAPAADRAFHIVIRNRPARPAFGHRRFQPGDRVADVGRAVVVHQQLEAVAHVQAPVLGVLGGGGQRVFRRDLAQAHRARILIQQRAQLLQEWQVLRLGVVVEVVLVGVRVVRTEAAAHALVRRLGRVIAQLRVVEAEVDRIQAEAVHAAVQPEPHIVQGGLLHIRVMEVQVRLVDQKVVQVVLLTARLPLPGAATEQRQPVVGRGAVLARVGPDVPVGLRIAAVLAALAEPGVLDRGMAQHLVDHHLQAQAMGLGQQAVEVIQVAEQRVDVAVVGDVVAEVGHGGLEERRDPDCVHAQRGDVVQALDDARQVAYSITVGIEVAARVDLVDDGSAPPWIVRHRQPPSGHAGPARSGPKSCSGKLSGGPAGMAQPAYVFTQAAAFAGPGTPARPVCARIHGQRL